MKNLQTLVETLQEASISESSKRCYESGIKQFLACGGEIPCKPEMLANYLAELSTTHKWATIQLRAAAIHYAHTRDDLESPAQSALVKKVMHGIRRTVSSGQRRVRALMKDELVATLTLARQQQPRKAARDLALLLIAWSGAFRRSELVAINYEHLSWCSDGLEVYIPKSKTDQHGEGRTVFIPQAIGAFCPIAALKTWLACSKTESGAVFRAVTRYDTVSRKALCGHSVALIVKEAVWRLKGAEAAQYSGHSTRAGFVTSAVVAGVPLPEIASVTGHKSQTVLAKYVRLGNQRRIKSLL